MKKLLMTCVVCLGVCSFAQAESTVRLSSEIRDLSVGKTQTVAISSTTWTRFPASNDPYRTGMIIDNSPLNSNMMVFFSTSPTAALSSLTTSNEGHTIRPTDAPAYIKATADIYLFAISSQTAAATQNLHITEYRNVK